MNKLELRQFTSSDFCLKCFGCCRFKEKKSIWKPQDIELIPYKDYFLCLNLDLRKNLCKIYPQRPFDCQLYPFLLNREKNRVFLSVHLNCPFIEKNLKKKSFKIYLGYLKDYLSKTKIKKKFILEYPKDEILYLERL